MDTESQRIYDRMSLHRLSVGHPDWKAPKLAEAVGRSERWARKWLSRFKESDTHQFSMYLSQSRGFCCKKLINGLFCGTSRQKSSERSAKSMANPFKWRHYDRSPR